MKEISTGIEKDILKPLSSFKKMDMDVRRNIISIEYFIQQHQGLSKHIKELFGRNS